MRVAVGHVLRQEPQELQQDRQISSRQPGALSQSPCCPTCRLLLSLLYHAALIRVSVPLSLIAVLSVPLLRLTTTRTLSVKRATPITPPPAPIRSPPTSTPSRTLRQVAPADSDGVQSGQSEMKQIIFFSFFWHSSSCAHAPVNMKSQQELLVQAK